MSDLPPETSGKRVVIFMIVAAVVLISAWVLLAKYGR